MDPQRPWLTEPNEVLWESSRYQCLLLRHHLGQWCGYVVVPPHHPWSGLSYRANVEPIADELEPSAKLEILQAFFHGLPPDGKVPLVLTLRAHGGITYAGRVHELGRDIAHSLPDYWCFGFDCGHYDLNDLIPDIELNDLIPERLRGSEYRDQDYAMGVCNRIAAQLRIVEQRAYPEPTQRWTIK